MLRRAGCASVARQTFAEATGSLHCARLSWHTRARRTGCLFPCAVTITPRRHFFSFGGSAGAEAEDGAGTPKAVSGSSGGGGAKELTASEKEMRRLQEMFRKTPQQTRIEEKITAIKHNILKPLDTSLNLVSDVTYTNPMVMLIGNHSSGKSTLINYLCGREIQETGVAPTDDGFTILRRGNFDMNEDGPTAINTPAYQFQALQPFGYDFINRFKVKIRTMPPTSLISPDLLLVDTPGMIDTPALQRGDRASIEGQARGYDFIAVARWFAQRSDVILLMFDPANPGTTGETLDVLTRSLAGFEHKFLLVLNKVDMFEKVNDFARAYGTLCWNLSKVIKLKDIPRIYTTCTPLTQATVGTHAQEMAAAGVPAASPALAAEAPAEDAESKLAKTPTAAAAKPSAPSAPSAPSFPSCPIPVEEIQRQRKQVIDELLSAPLRRLDNSITETEENAKCLMMAMQVGNALRYQYRQREALVYLSLGLGCCLGPLALMSLVSMSISATVWATLLFLTAGGLGVLGGQQHLRAFDDALLQAADGTIGRLYMGKEKTRDVELRWHNVVRPELMRLAQAARADNKPGTSVLPTGSRRAIAQLKSVLSTELPALRSEVNQFKREEHEKRWSQFSQAIV